MVGINIDRARSGSERGEGVIAQIETRDGDGLFRAPMTDAEVAVIVFVELASGGDEAQAARPTHGQVIVGKIGGVAKMGIPDFARPDIEHTVSGIFDDVSAVTETQREFGPALGRRRQYNIEVIIAARAAFVQVHALVLKKGERFPALAGDFS